jgi:hypothetical protein
MVFSALVNGVRVGSARRSRVYTIWGAWLVALLAGLTGGVTAQTAPELCVNPIMVKGPPTAAVTIVEFSDYQ